MKKMQLAHADVVLKKVSIPDIKVTDAPSSEKRNPDPRAAEGPNLMAPPVGPVDLKSHYHPLKAVQSHLAPHHVPTIAEQGKNVYHSEPANLNGFVRTPPDLPRFPR